jgi:hypothetical protein
MVGGKAIVHHRADPAAPRRHAANGGIGPTRIALVAQHEAAAMNEQQDRFQTALRRGIEIKPVPSCGP